MVRKDEGKELLLNEYAVAVYTTGRVEWNGLQLYLRRHPDAWAELSASVHMRKRVRPFGRFAEPAGVYQAA